MIGYRMRVLNWRKGSVKYLGFYVGRYSLCDQTLMGLSTVLFTSKLYVKMVYGDTFQIINLYWLKVHFYIPIRFPI